MRGVAVRGLLLAVTFVVAAGCLPVIPPPASPPSNPRRIGVYGDSVALTLGWEAGIGLHNRATYVGGEQQLGCGIGRGGLRFHVGRVGDIPQHCNDQYPRWADHARRERVDVAIILAGPWDQLLRVFPGDNQWRALGDPAYDQYLLGEMLFATDTLLGAGVKEVVWLSPPPMYTGEHSRAVADTRAGAYRGLIGWVDTLRNDVTIADQWIWSYFDGGTDGLVRPDGIHFSKEGAVYTWRKWLGDLAVAAAG